MIHPSLVCRGCSGTLYALSTAHPASVRTWEVDHDSTPTSCPLEPVLPLTGEGAHIHQLTHADHVLASA
ncbi:hypothetical protein ACIQV3_39745 [Streptomyces sp. NPDC099050]|uniref:hypothetical protein n=1 Tax=Streptomyces sp. NPDC099050 TaxID=3366100 RepID=UPI003819C652